MGRLRLGLGLESEPHVVGRLRLGPRVGGGVISGGGVFSVGGLSPGELSSGGWLSPRIVVSGVVPVRGEGLFVHQK